MVAGDQSQPVDVLVLGGGPGGYVTAIRAAQCGRDVTLVERARLGGVCLNAGCVPSKALAELAAMRSRASQLESAGLGLTAGRVDLAAFQVWKQAVVDRLVAGVEGLLERNGVKMARGTARFMSRNRVAVVGSSGSATYFDFTDVVIATGASAMAHPALPFEGNRVVDPASALTWAEVPEELVVVGGDYLALERATAYGRLGGQVTLVTELDRLLPEMDVDISRAALHGARRCGVDVLLSSVPLGLDDTCVAVRSKGGELKVPASRVIVSAGRRAIFQDLDLGAARLRAADDHLVVNDQLRVERHVIAVGDVTAGEALADRAMHQGRVAGEVLAGRRVGFDAVVVPVAVFAEPELAAAGLTEPAARERGYDAAVARLPLAAIARGLMAGTEPGFVKLVYDRSTGVVVGTHLVGPRATDLIGSAAIAIEMGAGLADIALTMQPHPTFAEGLAEAAEVGLGNAIHYFSRSPQRGSVA